MRPLVPLALLVAALSVHALPGDTEVRQLESSRAADAEAVAPTIDITPRLSKASADAMTAEIQAMFDAQLAREEAFVADMPSMTLEQRDAAAQRLEAANEELMTEVLRVQMRYAQEAGLSDLAEMFAAKIEMRVQAEQLPTHIALDAAGKTTRQPSIATLPAVPVPSAGDQKGFNEGGEQR